MQLGNLHGDGLDVHAVDAVLDQIEFASVVEFVGGECLLEVGKHFFAHRDIGNFPGFGDLPLFPALISWVELAEHEYQLVENPTGKAPEPQAGSRIFRWSIALMSASTSCSLKAVRFFVEGEKVAAGGPRHRARPTMPP